MTYGLISYTEQGEVSIDSGIKGFALTGTETYTANVDTNYRTTGWEIKKKPDEILVLVESSHLVTVHSIDVKTETTIIGVLGNYMSNEERWSGQRQPREATIKILRFTSKVSSLKDWGIHVYSDSNDLAFSSAQPMLRPAGYFPVPKAELQKPPIYIENHGIEYPVAADKPLGVVLDLSARRFRYDNSSYIGGTVGGIISASMFACYKVTPKYICRQLVRRGRLEQVRWGNKTVPLFPSYHLMFPVQEGLLVHL